MADSFWTRILTLLATVSPVALQTDGGFSQWSTWTLPSCAVTCGASAETRVQRTRACNNPPPSNGGSNCTGPFTETTVLNCNLLNCPVCVPVNGGFSQWTRWTNPSCPVTCRSSATRRVEKTRRCDSPLPNKCGRYCIGVAYRYEDRNCQLPDCQDDVGFNEWGEWTGPTCDVTCGASATKSITRERTCMYPSPQNDSGNCTGPFEQTATVNCNLIDCPVNGGISEWGQWDHPPCPGSCDGMANTTVSRTRNRTCSNPPPSNGGRDCTEIRMETDRKNCCSDSSSTTWKLVVGISVGIAALLGLIVIMVCVGRRRNWPQKVQKGVYSFKKKPFVPDRLELIALLGEGKFGEVWKARALDVLSSGQWDFVAVKKCKGNATEAVRQDFKHEIELMKSLPKHPHVVNYLSSSTKAGSDMLLLELAPLGNLLNLLRLRRPKPGAGSLPRSPSPSAETQELTSEQLTMFAHQVARGMKHLQYNRIIHRDLAARNVLLGENLVCKVSDLGLARQLSDTNEDAYETKSEGPLPIRWMAPESLKDRLFSTKSDVWSFGILLWEIVTLGASPYPGQSARDVMSFVTTGGRMPRPDHCAPELFSLMPKCWCQDPESRPDFEVLSSELDTLLEESGDYIQLSDYHNLYLILQGQSGNLEEKV